MPTQGVCGGPAVMWERMGSAGWRLVDEDGVVAAVFELTWTDGDGLRREVWVENVARQGVVEFSITNLGDDALDVDDCLLDVSVGEGWQGWAWAAGIDGFIALSSAESTFVLRVRRGVLRQLGGPHGTQMAVTPSGLRLEGGARYRWDCDLTRCDSLAQVGDALPVWLPSLAVMDGDPLRFALPDHAVLPGDNLDVSTDELGIAVEAPVGVHEVQVAGPGGVHRLACAWVPRHETALSRLVASAMQHPARVALDSVGALVALAAKPDDQDAFTWLESEDWLARGSLLATLTAGLLACATDDRYLLQAARERLASLGPTALVELVAVRLWLADGAANQERPQTPMLDHLDVDALVRTLGAGLPGVSLTADDERLGQCVALLRFVPDGVPDAETRAAAVQRAEGRLLAQAVTDSPTVEKSLAGLAWMQISWF